VECRASDCTNLDRRVALGESGDVGMSQAVNIGETFVGLVFDAGGF
jgi:hypothetical protein